MKLIHNVNNLIDLLLILIVRCVINFDKRGRRYIVRPSMAIPSNFNFELLGVLVSFSFTIIHTCPNDKDIAGQYMISPKNVDWMLRGPLHLSYFTSTFGSSS